MQVGDVGLDPITMLFQLCDPLILRCRTTFSQFGVTQHFADRHPGHPQATQKLDPNEDGCVVVALCRSVPVGVRKQPDTLVIADGVGR